MLSVRVSVAMGGGWALYLAYGFAVDFEVGVWVWLLGVEDLFDC
jgi:hypothetical protein